MSDIECGSMGDIIIDRDRVWIHRSHNNIGGHIVEPLETSSLREKDCVSMGAIVIEGERVWSHGSHHH